jgi:adenine-specific DNA-methyltransferase
MAAVIKYLGSKRTLVADLLGLLRGLPELRSVLDLFSGTSRVGHALKAAGYRVSSNDHNAYAHSLATCYVQADREDVARDATRLLGELQRLPGKPGYFTETFCLKSRFFQPHNGERIDAIRDAIEAKSLPETLKHVLLVSLMEAADRVDSTCGLQMAYVKDWAPRSFNRLQLRMPDVLPASPHGPCRAYQLDAREAARTIEADVAYLDPPYNQHSYLANYHIWESLVLWDEPEVYGVACKRVDVRQRKSDFNKKRQHVEAFRDTFHALRSPLVVVSFNNEGYQTREQLEALLAERGPVFVVSKDFKRYVGAQIGIYNPSGDRVGEVSHLRNKEFIYLVPTERDARGAALAERLAQLTAEAPAPAQVTLAFDSSSKSPRTTRASNTDELRGELLQLLQARGPLAATEIERDLGLSGYHVRLHLSALLGDGVVIKSDRRPARYQLA